MKDKIEITQSDMLSLLVDKIEFLTTEYKNLHGSFGYKGRGRTKTDPLKIATSYESFLKEEGDIKRLLELYKLFTGSEIKKTASK